MQLAKSVAHRSKPDTHPDVESAIENAKINLQYLWEDRGDYFAADESEIQDIMIRLANACDEVSDAINELYIKS